MIRAVVPGWIGALKMQAASAQADATSEEPQEWKRESQIVAERLAAPPANLDGAS